MEADLRPIGTVVWATGFRPRYRSLDPRLLDPKGRLVHDGGVLPVPGMYVLGCRSSRLSQVESLDGVGADADDLAIPRRSSRNHRQPGVTGGDSSQRSNVTSSP